MFQQISAIIRNTFFESIRQPVMLVVLVVATMLIILSNPLSGFTMTNDQKMLIDIGLATVFICGAILASFIASGVLGREIENRTALTVISKPVNRPLFVIGKYLGVAAALTVATAYMGFVFLLVEQHSVLQTVRDPVHLPVITFGVGAAVIGLGVGIWCNYFYNKVFTSTVICVTTPLIALGYFFSLMFRPDFSMQPMGIAWKPQLLLALCGLLVAVLVLTAIAIAASTRFGQIQTLCITVGIFVAGMLSDWYFGQHLQSLQKSWLNKARAENQTQMVERTRTIPWVHEKPETFTEKIEQPLVPLTTFATRDEKIDYSMTKIGYSIVPNFQVLWLSDALTQDHRIPVSYIAVTSLYGAFHIIAFLGVAVLLFQRRELG
jgi:ABC-2 type transport system permease protein